MAIFEPPKRIINVPLPPKRDEAFYRELGYTDQKDLDFLTYKDKK